MPIPTQPGYATPKPTHLDHTDSLIAPLATSNDSTDAWYFTVGSRRVGVAINTPSGLMLWKHDYDADQSVGGFVALCHGVVDDLDSARAHLRENEAYGVTLP